MEILAVIPARGGSKSIPRKNIKLLAGKPLIAWSIEAAQQSRLITRVIVSTDDEEIAVAARQHGAETPFVRPPEIAGDDTPDTPVFEHCVAWLQEHEGYRSDIIAHLRPTGPLRTAQEIDEAIALLMRHPEADSVRSAEEPEKPPFKMWRPDGEYIIPFAPLPGMKDSHTAPRQLLPKVYQTTADIGVFWTRTLQDKKSIIGERVLPYVLARPTVDIDREIDFAIAELLLKMR
jgi:N-acylneuraminate cytidylyltransferase